MSDLLDAAAAALGAPPELVMRSAQARSEAEGTAVDDILAAWAGGKPPPQAATREAQPEPAKAEPAEPADEPSVQEPVPEVAAPVDTPTPAPTAAAVAPPASVSIADAAAPVLVGKRESPTSLVAVLAALFLVGFLGTVVVPVYATDTGDAAIPLRSETAELGRQVYVGEGCWYCHTQLVRPVVTDAGLGPVTTPGEYGAELPVTVGVVRIGPDLARAGLRPQTSDAAAVEAFLRDPGDRAHQSYRYLSDADLAALAEYVTFLR